MKLGDHTLRLEKEDIHENSHLNTIDMNEKLHELIKDKKSNWTIITRLTMSDHCAAYDIDEIDKIKNMSMNRSKFNFLYDKLNRILNTGIFENYKVIDITYRFADDFSKDSWYIFIEKSMKEQGINNEK